MIRGNLRILAALVLAVGVGAIPTAASAGGKKKDDATNAQRQKEAREHYEQGVRHANLDEYDQAIDEFKKAYVLTNAPVLLFNIAQAYRKKDDFSKALDFYRKYLSEVPEAKNRPEVEERIAEMEKQLQAAAKLRNDRPQGMLPPEPAAPLVAKPAPVPVPVSSSSSTSAPTPPAPVAAPVSAPAPPSPAQPAKPSTVAAPPAVTAEDAGRPTVSAKAAPREMGLGMVLRADLDGGGRGGVGLVGATFWVTERIELTGAGILGVDKGAWVGATYSLMRSALRPTLTVGAPLFFVDGVRPGLHLAAGARWDLTRHLGLSIGLGAAHFPTVPGQYDKTIILLSTGVHATL